MKKPTRKVHFSWMGAYWSCTPEAWDTLQAAIAENKPFDLYALGARELRSRPAGARLALRDTEVINKT